MTEKTIIKLKDIYKEINQVPLFRLSQLMVELGDFVTIQGVSGSGKTTLLNILGMNASYSQGEYLFEENNVKQMTAKQKKLIKRNRLSFLFQDFGLIEYETIDFNLEIGLKYVRLKNKKKRDLKKEALAKVHLDKKLNTKVETLSGGEKQRVAFARIMLKPSVLLLADEPTGSLDATNREIVTDLLLEQAKEGKAVVVVTHDPYVSAKGNKQIIL